MIRRGLPGLAFLAACGAPAGLAVEGAEVRIAPAAATTAAVYFTVRNPTDAGDTLVAISGGSGGTITLHESMDHGDGALMMMPLTWVAVAPHDSAVFRQGERHGMLEGFTTPPAIGDTLALTFRFARAGERVVRAPVRAVGGGE